VAASADGLQARLVDVVPASRRCGQVALMRDVATRADALAAAASLAVPAWKTRGMEDAKVTVDELVAFEIATHDLVGLALRSVEDLEVSLPQLRLLLVLEQRGRSTSTECAQALGVVGSSVTRLADRLHASGHLVRGADPDNRSVVTLELTDAGGRLARRATSSRRRELSRALDLLEPAERAACVSGLTKLHRVLAPTAPTGATALPF
jgi:DNA-binding MarR family transcriptional regulator